MKIRSRALHDYLFALGVLNGTPDAIDAAKRSYRRLYKKRWKQAKRPRKEIRIEFTLKQFEVIRLRAQEHEMKHTAYARNAILQAITGTHIPYGHDRLLQILQLVSMATIATSHEPGAERAHQLLLQAENLLLQHIKRTETKKNDNENT